ncbi:MAG: A24 family peptidase [Gemmataceae bacterium]
MATELSAAPPAATLPSIVDTPLPTVANATVVQTPADDLGVDRAFLMSMARVPLIAIAWALAGYLSHFAWAAVAPEGTPNFGPVAVLCFGMVLAAFIDGYAFKVPNWLTLSLVVSGWYLGLAHDLGITEAGFGGIGQALLGTFIGFIALFPALFIGGMGQGDVKMTMGFGSWCGAYFGAQYLCPNGEIVSATGMIWWSFCVGVIVGGIFGIVMMALRRQLHKNASNFGAIANDLKTMFTHGPKKAAEQANSRRADWVRLPYGVPLCVGFLGFLWYQLYLVG